jgi:hypothetical protein
MAELGDRSNASKELSKLRSSPNIPPKTRIDLRVRVINALIAVDRAAARKEIETCIEEISNLENARPRERYFAAMVGRFTAIDDTVRARAIAERSGSVEEILTGYKHILDSMIATRSPANGLKYGLADSQSPEAIDTFSN